MKKKHELRFRQVHLDFHTSPMIPGIGKAFDKKLWQERLKMAHVDSITCFSSCHHGWSYHPTKVGAMHPGLDFNLLRAEIDACHEIDVKVPIYLTAGINNRLAELQPGWREVNPQGQWNGWVQSPLKAGFKSLCFNSPYLDYLCRLIEEAARLFPDADGMFFDIISQGQCCCPWCMRDMAAEGYDPEKEEDRKRFARRTLVKYYEKCTAAARCVNPDLPVFHNKGILPGNRDLLPFYSHLELESLPTGGWGYDHFPLLAAFCRTLEDYDFLGMTGKFHTTWGEFGGFKHPNALRYECAAMIAQGARCSIGDQLHPSGMLDESTCRLIGAAYAEVETKEPWCRGAASAATVAILSDGGFLKQLDPDETSEIGISRLLLEGHIPFDRLDDGGDFSKYKVLVLPEALRPDAALRKRLERFMGIGGKLILAGEALLKQEKDEPAFDLPLKHDGTADLFPNFIQIAPEFADTVTTPFVMYHPSQKIKLTGGRSLGRIYDPYFNRNYLHFCSHQHTPFKPEPSGYEAGVLTDQILYFAHPVFRLYALYGNVVMKDFLLKAIRSLLGDDLVIETNLPSQGRVSLMEQKEERRYVAHALYANTILRGMNGEWYTDHIRPSKPVQVIEELNPLHEVKFTFRLPKKIQYVSLEPQGVEIPFTEKFGKVELTLGKLVCHQMIVLHYY
jgi:hypothetical protein